VSHDCGTTWTTPLLIEPQSGGKAFSYPTIDLCGTDPVSGPRVCTVYTYLVPAVPKAWHRSVGHSFCVLSRFDHATTIVGYLYSVTAFQCQRFPAIRRSLS